MTLRSTVVAMLMVLVAATAVGDRASTLLDALETKVQTRLTAEENLQEPDRKIVKLLKGVLKKLGKETTTDAADVKLLKRVVGPLSGRLGDDVEITGAIDGAVTTADAGVVAAIAAARALIGAAKDSKKKAGRTL